MEAPCSLIDQRTQVGSDGRAPEDGNMDCVPASAASMASGLLGGPTQNADAYHDRVYGQGYVGMQDPAAYVTLLAALGLAFTPWRGAPADLLTHAIACIRAHEPVMLSIPSDWDASVPRSPNAHMVAGCDVDSSKGTDWDHLMLTAMNPWGTKENGYSHAGYQTESLNWWAARLAECSYKATWVMSRKAGSTAVWHQQSDGSGKDDAGHVCGAGIMSYLVANTLTGSDGLLSETYYDGPQCALPLANGRIVTAAPDAQGTWHMGEQGAQAFVSVWQQLQAAKATPAPPPPDPVAEELKAATHAWLAAAQKA